MEGIGEFPNALLGFAWGYQHHLTLQLASQKVGCHATVTVVVKKRWKTADNLNLALLIHLKKASQTWVVMMQELIVSLPGRAVDARAPEHCP